MTFIMMLAFRNIWRYKRRTIITFVGLSVGISAFIFVDSLLKGAHYESLRNFIDYESGHLKIYNSAFYTEMSDEGFLPLDRGIDNYEYIEKLIRSEGLPSAPRIMFGAQLINEEAGNERPFTIIGIDPEKDKDVYKLPSAIISGSFLRSGENGIIIGRMGAEKIEAKIGDTLTILTRTKNDTYQTISVEVIGIIDPPNPNISRASAYIPLDICDIDLEMDGSVTEVGIRAKSDNIDELSNRLDSLLKGNGLYQLQIVSWKELGKDWLTLSKTKTTGSYALIFMVFVISAVGVINTMLMSVFERIKEIGMMRALGMRDSEVLSCFIFEGAYVGLLGAILGIFIGLPLDFYLIYHGWDLSYYLKDMDIGYRVMGVMRGVWDPGSFIFAFASSIAIPALISIYPSRKAIKMEITQALRTA